MKKAIIFLYLLPQLLIAQQWEKQSVNTDASFRSISVVNDKIVWAGGTKGTVIKTIDSGKNWQVITVPGAETLDFRDIYAVNDKVAYLMSAGEAEKGQARIYKTSDGGKTFQLQYETRQAGVFFDAIDFWDAETGIVFSDPVNGKFFILTTSDGGKNWNQIAPENMPSVHENEAAFAASGTCLVTQGKQNVFIGTGGMGGGRVFYSNDRGKTWQLSSTPFKTGISAGIFGLLFIDEKNGLAVGGDYQNSSETSLCLSNDGGKTWRLLENKDFKLLESAVTTKQKKIIAVGQGSFISEDAGQTWKKIDESIYHASGCKGKIVWAAGAKGNVGKLSF
jgi:photosystem II stability/assembly factor-like uncharacterized protein